MFLSQDFAIASQFEQLNEIFISYQTLALAR